MSHLNFDEKIHDFNQKQELAEVIIEDTAEEKWKLLSASEISRLLDLNEEETKRVMNSGLFKLYRVGNEFRASEKSIEESQKIVKAITNYREKTTMSVPDLRRILGLGKTATYRLVNKCWFKTYLVFGVMRIDVQSFEEWYSGQFHYKKVDGERPGQKYGDTIGPTTVAKVLGIPRGTANDLMNNGHVEFIKVNGYRRIFRESFEKWYESQDKYKKVMEVEEAEGFVD